MPRTSDVDGCILSKSGFCRHRRSHYASLRVRVAQPSVFLVEIMGIQKWSGDSGLALMAPGNLQVENCILNTLKLVPEVTRSAMGDPRKRRERRITFIEVSASSSPRPVNFYIRVLEGILYCRFPGRSE
ncbi:hypothetical protein RRG08_033717 [Elysia crispata]|uniref:Uncharacterized protein n=1 Tax=Elysia crispata TaxID=231223 RepID=A0AAE1A9H1_9GAST|nr:hypothetical protein RRG08_033717 [Elysia crispata]